MHEHRADYRSYIRGNGIEIGALGSPYAVDPGVGVLYSDIMTPEQIDALYPGARHPDIISDSESFPSIADNAFDFVIANHVLEHITDPIKALCEWHRILADGGHVLMAIPDKRLTFDRGRSRTTLRHLIADHASTVEPCKRNLPHLHEWATHVEKLAEDTPEWRNWVASQVAAGYTVHNHVWVMADLFELLRYLRARCAIGFSIVRCNNTPRRDIEFIFLLRAEKHPLPVLAEFARHVAFTTRWGLHGGLGSVHGYLELSDRHSAPLREKFKRWLRPVVPYALLRALRRLRG